MGKKIKIGKKLTALIITVLVFFVISCLHLLGVFHFLEYKSYDMRVRFWSETSFSRPSDEIVVILLDQDSLDWAQKEKGWGWPWPRQAYAEIVDYMNLSGAKSIAFDVIFSEPSVYRNAKQDEIIDNAVNALEEAALENAERQATSPSGGRQSAGGRQPQAETGGEAPRPRTGFRIAIDALRSLSAREDDASFADASKNFGHVVQTIMFSSQTGSAFSWPVGLNPPLFQPENFGTMLERFSVGASERGQFPIPELRESAGALGSVTGIPDSDGIVRRLRPFTMFDGKAVPGLSSASLLVSGKGQQIFYNSKTEALDWDGISIPVDKNGNALLRYHGIIERYIPYRVMDILLSAEAVKNDDKTYIESGNFLSPENFQGTYVFFGFYAQGLFDIFNTPISSVYPGMGCHITMLDNMLQGNFIRENSEWLNLLILLAVVVLLVFLTMFSSRITMSVSGMAVIVVIIITGAFAAYQFGGLWVPMVTYLAGTLSAFVTVTLYNYATEGSQKRFIKSAFSQYLSPKVIEQIIHDPSQLKLGGEKREMTAIFTDVRSFSTISEALGDPAKLVELLNFYLTRMSNLVLDNQGTIDKYEGDAIIAFFGAPIHMENHASLACRAAVHMKKAEVEINRDALEQGLVTPKVMEALAGKKIIKSIDDPCPLFTRLGINTGDMVVGNMGTPNKMDYTIMGNAVNLAARLEGVNKQYDTGGILISEYTRTHIGDEFVLRPLSRVRVVGINTPLRLYELLDIADEATPDLLNMVKQWEQAFSLYEKRDFLAAQKILQDIYGKNSGDLAAKKYLDRCVKFQSSPPDEKTWDNGVDNLTEK
ncbi:MAG: adenylate/guanylate cyclase domain-containing protein [Treponema sp.]|jgi:class 3 adenylate cyclase/CHASE2 domain-containing sensor protein|nr:adenylate/guanylate cyclase domain-containing protein [Treponema sp.]